MSKVILYVLGVIVLVAAAAGGGFFAGQAYAQSQTQNTLANFTRQRGANPTDANPQATSAGACGFGQRGASGTNTGTGATPSGGTPPAGANPSGRQGGGALGGAAFAQLGQCVARGQIKLISGNTVEVSTADKVVTVKVDDKTVISKTDTGTISDLKEGDRVTVFSRETGDNPTASAVQIQRAPNGQ